MSSNETLLDALFNKDESTKKKSILQVSNERLEKINELKSKFNMTTYAMGDLLLQLGINLVEERMKTK